MGIFDLIRNSYRKLTGQISIEQERNYRGWLANQGVKNKIQIKKACTSENLAVNTALQVAVYEKDKKFVKAAELRKERREDLERYRAMSYKHNGYQNYPAEKLVPVKLKIQRESYSEDKPHSIADKRFKEVLVNYVKAYYWDVPVENQKKIYLNLTNLYREIYEDSASKEVEDMEKKLIELTIRARQKREETAGQRRIDFRNKSLERLAVAA